MYGGKFPSKSIGLALQFCFVLLCKVEGNFQVRAPRGGGGAYIWRGDLTEGFCVTSLGGLYFRNFTQCFLLNMTKKVSRWLIQLK